MTTSDDSQFTARIDPAYSVKVGDTIELGVTVEKCHFFDLERTTYDTGKEEEKAIV